MIPHKFGLIITNNDHKNNHQTMQEYIEIHKELDNINWIHEEEEKKCIDNDCIWDVCWYPNTPGGNYNLHASSIQSLMDYLIRNIGDFK
jgi:hypothetical protein